MYNKKVKIIATIGPASNSYHTLFELAKEGVDIYRINLSHQPHDEIVRLVSDMRKVEEKIGRPLTIMGDLAGPKIRIGKVDKNVVLKNNDKVEIISKAVLGTSSKLSVNYPTIIGQLKKGAEIFVDDGKIRMVVEEEGKEKAVAKVVVGGPLVSFKGFYAQGLSLENHGLTKKDREDVALMVKAGVDALAVSFVQTEKDIEAVKKLLPNDKQLMIIAKIETAKAIDNIEKIIAVSDGVMVARGDLGLAVPMAEVPHLQKQLIEICLKKAKPVITATQMLESMTNNPLPTRAEVTDVANAILDGTDAVMLSGETAMGKFPVETVKMMAQIITSAVPHVTRREFDHEQAVGNAVSSNVGHVADQIGARLVVAFTHRGKAASRIARHRSQQSIIALTPVKDTLYRLNFSWGVFPFEINPTKGFMDMVDQAKNIAFKNPVIKLHKGEPFVIAAGMPFGQTGTTNMILVEKV
ncbi:MAG: pyruvate kinase [Candidatus Levybacteria bacterium]|nr:pyruvate kinase [Candidatus Levybacteria bacterium]